MKLISLAIALLLLCASIGGAGEVENGTYFHGGAIVTIKRLDDNNDWVTAKNGGRYKYRVDCLNCGECWHVGDECYLVSESWEKMQSKEAP